MNDALMSNLIWVILVVIDLGIRIAALIIVPRRRKPSSAMAWLLAIFLIPFVGILFFLVIGRAKLPKKRLELQKTVDGMIAEGAAGLRLTPRRSTWPRWFDTLVGQNERLTRIPPSDGNTATLSGDYEQSIAAMTAEIGTATRFVHVEYFIVSFDATTKEFFAALEAAVQRGVTVRLLADHLSSVRAAHSKETFAELDRIGVTWSFMLPFQPFKGHLQRPDLRNHRKLVVVDGRVAFMGSQNLIDRTYNSTKNLKRGLKWQELTTRLTGPVVASINAVFLGDWFSETGELIENENVRADAVPMATGPEALECQLVPSGPGYDFENNLRMFLGLIYGAQQKVIITSPYFVPDESMMYAITAACQRGLDVQLFVSEIGDQAPVFHAQRSYYSDLLEVGVRIFQYPAPFILHAKHLSIDDDVAVIGSSNMDIRSFNLDLEISLLVRGRSFVDGMREVEEHYRAIGRELTLEEWRREPLSRTAFDGLARLTSALE